MFLTLLQLFHFCPHQKTFHILCMYSVLSYHLQRKLRGFLQPNQQDYALHLDCQDCHTLYIFRCTHQQTRVPHTASLCQNHRLCPDKRDQYIFCIRDTQNLSFQNRSKYVRVRRILPQFEQEYHKSFHPPLLPLYTSCHNP